MTASNKKIRVLWKDTELLAVAAAVYRQFKHDFKTCMPIAPGERRVWPDDVKKGQAVALIDRSRHKEDISSSICDAVQAAVQKIVGENAPSEATLREAKATLNRPVTIDLQIRSLVRSELLGQQPALLARVEELLSSHERNIQAMLDRSEQRLIQFWGGNAPPEQSSGPAVVEVPKVRKFRVLVACLRSDQHHLIRDRLKHAEDHVEVVILTQDDGFVGVKSDYYDKVLVLSKFIGHSHFAKIQSIFSKSQIVVKPGAALTAATTILSMLEEQPASR